MHIKKTTATTAILAALLQFGESFSSSLTNEALQQTNVGMDCEVLEQTEKQDSPWLQQFLQNFSSPWNNGVVLLPNVRKEEESSSTSHESHRLALTPPPPTDSALNTDEPRNTPTPLESEQRSEEMNSDLWLPLCQSIARSLTNQATPLQDVEMNCEALEQTEKQDFNSPETSLSSIIALISKNSNITVECKKLKLDQRAIPLLDKRINKDSTTHKTIISIGQLPIFLYHKKLLTHLIEEIIKDNRPSEDLASYNFKAIAMNKKSPFLLLLSPKEQDPIITQKQNEIIEQMVNLHNKYAVFKDILNDNYYLLKFEDQEDAQLYMSLKTSYSTDRYAFLPLITFEHPKKKEPSSTAPNSHHVASPPPYGPTAATSNPS